MTADYWGGYAGTKKVPAAQAAQWLNWVETGIDGAKQIAQLGVKTILYSNPHRIQPGTSMFTNDESVFAHDCSGQRVATSTRYAGQAMTDPHSEAMRQLWRQFVARRWQAAHFDAVFEDEAVGTAYAQDQPCGYNFDDWLRATIDAQRELGFPVIYNGLSDFYNHGVAREIALNATAIGGMMENCYAQLQVDHRVSDWKWVATENTEFRMAAAHKYFFCYGRDLTPADQAYPSRMYTYASFLLSYDLSTSVLWEYYQTPSGAHVMPEVQVVPLSPVRQVTNADGLRSSTGTYTREYRECYIDAKPVGPCAAAVNPDPNAAHALGLSGYTRTLQLQGSGIFDGGTIRINNQAPPSTLEPLGAVIAFR
ncbi:MAG: putative glycoside hydrolase [Vulcanimicrobiaceae bacterium]